MALDLKGCCTWATSGIVATLQDDKTKPARRGFFTNKHIFDVLAAVNKQGGTYQVQATEFCRLISRSIEGVPNEAAEEMSLWERAVRKLRGDTMSGRAVDRCCLSEGW